MISVNVGFTLFSKTVITILATKCICMKHEQCSLQNRKKSSILSGGDSIGSASAPHRRFFFFGGGEGRRGGIYLRMCCATPSVYFYFDKTNACMTKLGQNDAKKTVSIFFR